MNYSNQICRSCGNLLSVSKVKVLELLEFECAKCHTFETQILLKNIMEEKEKIIKCKDEIIVLLRQRIQI